MSKLKDDLQKFIDDISKDDIPAVPCESVDGHPVWPVDNGQGLFYMSVDLLWLALVRDVLMQARDELERTPAELRFVDEDEVEAVDFFMNEHMYHHSIANNINSMACNPACRTRALKTAMNNFIKSRR